MGEWSDFYVATAGAAAALTGLIFVGISINLQKILEYPQLPTRASISLMLLLAIVIFSVLLLIPVKSEKLIGPLVFILALATWLTVSRAGVKIYRLTTKEYKREFVINLLLDQFATLPYIIGGTMLLFHGENGLYWIAAAFILSFIKAVSDAWVLLVEILR